MPALSKKLFPFKLIILVGLLLLVVVTGIFFWLRTSPTEVISLTDQQQKLVDQFGYPDHFVLVFGEMVIEKEYEEIRYEAWNYDESGRRYNFVDGEFASDTNISFLIDADYPDLKPTYFTEGMNFDQVKKVIGADPSESVDAIPEIAENMTVYDFHGQIKVGVFEEEVVYIQTYPVISEEDAKER